MIGYVKRINDSTLRVPIGGVRIGSAKYSRLAQINLKTHIITFSRYAIENVPERGRRYLVLHELAHVKEASHNKNFWRIVAEHEPDYKHVGKELDKAFHDNVRAEMRREKNGNLITQGRLFPSSLNDDREIFDSFEYDPEFDPYAITGGSEEGNDLPVLHIENDGMRYPLDSGVILRPDEFFECNDGDFESWQLLEQGIVSGGSADDLPAGLTEEFFDHL